MTTPLCSVQKVPPRFLSGEDLVCDGPLVEAPRYFVDGRSLYKCQKHYLLARAINPMGPSFYTLGKAPKPRARKVKAV